VECGGLTPLFLRLQFFYDGKVWVNGYTEGVGKAAAGLRHSKNKTPRSKIPALSGPESGRQIWSYKKRKASSEEPGRTFLHQ